MSAGAVAAVVLAAGASSRFGAQKLLASLGGAPVVRLAVERVLAAEVDSVTVVLGREADAVRAALDGLPLRFAVNARWAAGMSTSLRAGVSAAAADGPGAILVALGDQPAVPREVFGRLLSVWRERRPPIVAPVYEGVRGNPVLFDAAVFGELLAVTGDEGARAVIAADAGRVALVELPFPMPADIDTVVDLERMASRAADQ